MVYISGNNSKQQHVKRNIHPHPQHLSTRNHRDWRNRRSNHLRKAIMNNQNNNTMNTRIRFQSYLPKVAYHVEVTGDSRKAAYFLSKQIQVYGGYDSDLLDKCKSVMRIYNLGLLSRKQCDLEMVDAGVPFNHGRA